MTGAFQDIEDNSKSLKKVADTLADIQKELDQFGLTDSQKKLDDLRALGATDEQLTQAEDNLSKLDALNAAKKKGEDMDQRAKSVIDATRTPLEKYDSKIGELSDLLNAGAIDWDTYGRAVRDARKELEDSDKAAVPQAPDLFLAGTAAAQKFTFDQTSGIQRLTKDDLRKEQLSEAKDANRFLDQIVRNTRNTGNGLEVTDIGVV